MIRRKWPFAAIRHASRGLALAAMPALAFGEAPQTTVTVTAVVSGVGSQTSGGGLVIRLRGHCVVVTAHHVVDGQDGIQIDTSAHEQWVGDVRDFSEAGDVATIESGTSGRQCSALPAADALAKAVQATDGELLIATKGGAMVPLPVSVRHVADDYIRIVSKISSIPIAQGMSGSPLMMQGMPVGILTGIAKKEDGEPGLAIRLDQAARLMQPDSLPIVAVTVVTSAVPLLASLGDSIARADAPGLAQYRETGVGAADFAAALRQPVGSGFVVGRFFDSLKADPARLPALTTLLDLGLPPDLIVPARDEDKETEPAYEKSLFWYAVDAGAVGAAITLLKRGASPHGYRTPEGTSPSNRMIFPTNYVFENVSDPGDRRRLFEAMIDAGLVVPIGPRRFFARKDGTSCEYANQPCPEASRGEWKAGYDVWPWKDGVPELKEVLAVRGGAVLRNFTGSVSCLAKQAHPPTVPADWQATLAKLPNYFAATKRKWGETAPDFDVEGFIGVFKDRAWFLTRHRGTVGWVDSGDNFTLMTVTRDGTRMELYSDQEICDHRSCLRAHKIEVSLHRGTMTIADDYDNRWIGKSICVPAAMLQRW